MIFMIGKSKLSAKGPSIEDVLSVRIKDAELDDFDGVNKSVQSIELIE